MILHSKSDVPIVLDEGFSIEPGTHARLAVTKTEVGNIYFNYFLIQ